MGDDIFDRAKERVAIVDLVERAGVKLRGGARQRRGACPFCGRGLKSKSAPFAVYPDNGTFKCWGCGVSGTVIDFELQNGGGTPFEAARRLLCGEYAAPKPREERRREADQSAKRMAERAGEIWAASRPLGDTMAWRYLVGRGIAEPLLEAASDRLRFHPFAPAAWDEVARRWIKAAALVVRPETPSGPTGGLHCTYLLRDGSGRDKALGKKMWGPQYDAEGRAGGAWIVGPTASGLEGSPAGGGEGIETSLSLATLFWLRTGRLMRTWAALSLDRLQGQPLADEEGCIDLGRPLLDPESRPFAWPPPAEDPWPRVVIAVDRDMSPLDVRGRNGRGRPCKFELDADGRARLCGALAVQAWQAAGSETVMALQPSPGMDFNDELRALRARGSAA